MKLSSLKSKIVTNNRISPQNEQGFSLLFQKTPESCILAIGIGIMLASLGVLALSWLWSPDKFQALVAMIATNIIFGRAAGLSVGYTMQIDHTMVIVINMLIETILVLLFYPLFVYSWHQLVIIPALRKVMKNTRMAAEANRDKIQKYGKFGLFIFVWSPFWMTGPVVGSAIGYLLGFKPWYTLTIVLSGTYLAITCWALFLRKVHEYIAMYSSFASVIILGIIILVVLISKLWHKLYPTGK